MGPVTTEDLVKTCAIQAARLERAAQENARLAAELAASRAALCVAEGEVLRLREAAQPPSG